MGVRSHPSHPPPPSDRPVLIKCDSEQKCLNIETEIKHTSAEHVIVMRQLYEDYDHVQNDSTLTLCPKRNNLRLSSMIV